MLAALRRLLTRKPEMVTLVLRSDQWKLIHYALDQGNGPLALELLVTSAFVRADGKEQPLMQIVKAPRPQERNDD